MGINYQIHTFGCKVNTYDSGLLETKLKSLDLKKDSRKVHVLNTCAVTKEATKQAQRQVRFLRAKDPLCLIVVTGCAAQVDTDKFETLKGVDLIVANSHKGQMERLIEDLYKGKLEERVFKGDIFKKKDLESSGGLNENRTRSFLKIQDGCDSFCTFCVIPFARGKSRSIPIDELVRKVLFLEEEGIKEITLSGVHIGDYEDASRKKDNRLEDLVEALLLKTRIKRIRLSSLEPVEISQRLLEFYKNPRMCPHFHMSIQSVQSDVLRLMKRKYKAEDVEEALLKIDKKVPNVFVGMDVIVGFPGENPLRFQETYDRLEKLPWTRIHVFPYSERRGTYATRLSGKVHRDEIRSRAYSLRRLSSRRYLEKAVKQVGSLKDVIVLNSKDEKIQKGLSEDYWNIHFRYHRRLSPGSEVSLKITGYDKTQKSRMDGPLLGQVAHEKS